MIAAPGAGKGTQGVLVAEHFGVPHIATGDLLRDHVARGTELGRAVRDAVERGELVPDDVVLAMVREALETCGGGYVLDGLPRTLAQARALYEMAVELDLTADAALHLRVEDEELVRRLLARAQEQGRADDTEEVVRRRLALYHEVTEPILSWYEQRGILVTVDGMRSPAAVTAEVLAELERVQRAHPAPDRTGLAAAFGGEQGA